MIIITGKPRSGTSMMTRCIHLAGVPLAFTPSQKGEAQEKAFAKSLDEVDDDDTQVKTYTLEKEAFEAQIKQFKLEKEAAPDGEGKKNAQQKINLAEDNLKKTEEKIKREKSRRQIGVDANPLSVTSTKDSFTAAKAEEAKLKDEFKDAMTAETDALAKVEELRKAGKEEEAKLAADAATKQIAELNTKKMELADKIVAAAKKQKEIAREAKKEKGTLGYAGVLEERGFWGSAVLGRVTAQDNEAGKAIRKQYEKSAKKTKRDIEQESLKDAIKDSAKKD